MTISLMPRQQELLRFIVGFKAAHGRTPMHDEMQSALGLKSKSSITRLLEGLEDRGAVRCSHDWRGRREIEVLADLAVSRAPDGAPLMAVRGPWWEAA